MISSSNCPLPSSITVSFGPVESVIYGFESIATGVFHLFGDLFTGIFNSLKGIDSEE